MNSLSRTLFALSALAVLAFFPRLAEAQVTWKGSNGIWSVGANWFNGFVPGSGTDAIIDSGTALLPSATTGTANNVFVGESGTGALSVSGSLADDSLVLGDSAGASGTATVTSTGTINNSGSVYVGNSGTGILNLNGGRISSGAGDSFFLGNNAGSSGSLIMTGGLLISGQSTLAVGVSGTGVLTMSGGTIFGEYIRFGDGTGGVGTGTVSSGSLDPFSYLVIGAGSSTTGGGAGSLLVNGGSVSVSSGGSVVLGDYATSSGTLTITSGSVIGNNASFIVGNRGTAVLNIQGGMVSYNNGTAIIGNTDTSIPSALGNSSGTMNVSGGTFSGGTTSLYVGISTGTGVFNISGGDVNMTLDVKLGNGQGSVGSGTVSSGTLNAGRYLTVGAGSNPGGAGSLLIDGGYVSVGLATVLGDYTGGTGTITITSGTLAGSGTMLGSGSMDIGNRSVGVMNVQGGLVTSSTATVGNTDTSMPAVLGNSSGTLNVSGGTFNVSHSLIVGTTTGVGRLYISGSGYVSDVNGFIGTGTGYVGAIGGGDFAMVTGGTWANSGTLMVGGSYSTGALLLNGGYLTSASALIGSGSSQQAGVATVGSGTWVNSGTLFVGGSGGGVLNISGRGVVNVNSGTGTVYLASDAGTTGTLNLGNGAVLSAAAIIGGSGTGVVNFTNTGSNTFAPQLAGSLSMNQTGDGVTFLTGTNTYTGSTTISAGTLRVNSTIASSSGVGVSSGATLAGSGVVSNISGAGTVAPGGNSILTASQVDPSGGLGFYFHMTLAGAPNYASATASGNDVLHLTGSTPFAFSLGSANTITLDFTGQILQPGQTYYGGIFTDTPIDDSVLNGATFDYVGLDGETVQYDGLVPVASAPFSTGTVTNGEVMAFTVQPAEVPVAPKWALGMLGMLLLFAAARGIALQRQE